jgi:DNA polymerase-3 subunit epsilon
VVGSGPPCFPAQLGVATCPCRGQIDEEAYGTLAGTVRRGLTSDPSVLCDPLAARMHRLAEAERFEEAAATRDRLAALTRALARRRALQMLRAAGDVSIEAEHGAVELRAGGVVLDDEPLATDHAAPDDEVLLVARWLERHARALRVIRVGGVLASALPRVPDVRARSQ